MKDIIDLLGRVCLSVIFLWDAIDFIIFFNSTSEGIKQFGIPFGADIILTIIITFLLIGGMMVLLGYRVALGSTMLLLYWIPATFIVYDFWNYDLPERRLESLMFWRNIAIAGGLMMLYAHGSGRYALRRVFATTKVPKW